MDLQEIRESLDTIDKQIVNLFEERMDLCVQVADFKVKNGKEILDKEREKQKIDAVSALAHNEFNKVGVSDLFEQIMAISRKLQYKQMSEKYGIEDITFTEVEEVETSDITVVFQGTDGAYSQMAMNRFFGEGVKNFRVDTFADAMKAIEEKKADFAVLPIENSTAGFVIEIYDLLVNYENVIVGEQVIPINHCLLGLPGTDMSQVSYVYSHPQSLMQSTNYLAEHPNWKQVTMLNNAYAAKKVAEDKDFTQVAIASEQAGKIYGLEVLQTGVQNEKENATRFIVISNKKIFRKSAEKISICFEASHESGSLYHALSHFIYNDLNICKIESRPIKDRSWEYRFFLDFDGNLSDPSVKNALRGLREETINLKILGNY